MAEVRMKALQDLTAIQQEFLTLWTLCDAAEAQWQVAKQELPTRLACCGDDLEQDYLGMELHVKDQLLTSTAHHTSETAKLMVEAVQGMKSAVESRISHFRSQINIEIDTFIAHVAAYEDALERIKECTCVPISSPLPITTSPKSSSSRIVSMLTGKGK